MCRECGLARRGARLVMAPLTRQPLPPPPRRQVWENIQYEAIRAFEKLLDGEAKVAVDDDESQGGGAPPGAPPIPPPSPPASPPGVDAAQGTMKVVLVSASGLLPADKNGLSDPYAVLKLGSKTRKSKVIKKTLDPTWNEQLDFFGPTEAMSALSIRVFDHDNIGRDVSAMSRADAPVPVLLARLGTDARKHASASARAASASAAC